MKVELLIQEAFLAYNKEMNKIYNELYSLKENYSNKEYNLILEGFWDRVKAIAKSAIGTAGTATGKVAGKTVVGVQKAVGAVHDFGKNVYDKGVELGKKAIEVGKELYTKVSNAVTQGIESIKKAPGLLWDSLTNLATTVSGELSEIYNKAKEKGDEWVKMAKDSAIKIYNTIATKLSNAYVSFKTWRKNNAEAFKQEIEQKKIEMIEAANVAKQSSIEGIKKLGGIISSWAKELKDGTIDYAKKGGTLMLGLLILPFYAAYVGIVKTYNLGNEFLTAMQSGIATIKRLLSKSWGLYVDSVKLGYAAEGPKVSKIKKDLDEAESEYDDEASMEPKKESFIITKFNNFKI
jgi:hypothetical protein